MLILGRRAGETLLIGDDIRITVVSTDKGRVRLAIDAPKNVPVMRSELMGAMDFNQEAAAEQSSPLELLELFGTTHD